MTSRPSGELSARAARIVREGSPIAPRRAWRRATSWQAIDARLARSRRLHLWGLFAFGMGGYAALAVFWAAPRTVVRVPTPPASSVASQWREVDLGAVGRLSLAPGARVRLPTPEPKPEDPYRVTLDEGQLCAQINHRDPARQRPFEVDAPDLKVSVVGTRFCVMAGNGPSWVAVEEGRVKVEGRAEQAVFVGGGECLHANDLRLTTSPSPVSPVVDLAPAPAPVPSAMPAPSPAAPRAHANSALSAENATYETVLRAVETRRGPAVLRSAEGYRSRFPRGVFSTEVDLYRLRELSAEGQSALALSSAEEFGRAHAGDWRADEAELIRADVLRTQLGRPGDALPIYERLVVSGRQTASLDERAFYGLCMSVHALSREVDAEGRFRQYLARFPGGTHRAEIEALLSRG